MEEYITKDSGKRKDFASGMRRDSIEGKPMFDLLIPKGTKYNESILYRWASLMTRGIEKYGYRNWEKANSQEELTRFKSSAFRHFVQWITGEDDEDHASAILFNVNAAEYLKAKIAKVKK